MLRIGYGAGREVLTADTYPSSVSLFSERFTSAMTSRCSTTRRTVTKPCTVIYVR